MIITHIDGIAVDKYASQCLIDGKRSEQYSREVEWIERPAGHPAYGSMRIETRYLALVFTPLSTDLSAARKGILKLLRWREGEERVFTTTTWDGSTATFPAAVVGLDLGNPASIVARLDVSQPYLEDATDDVTGPHSIKYTDRAVAVFNTGQLEANPVVTMGWSTNRTSGGAEIGMTYRNTSTITNNGTAPMRNYAVCLPVLDSAALISGGKSQADGDDVRVFVDGDEWHRYLVNWGSTEGRIWIVVPELPPGESILVEVVYGNTSATQAPALTDNDVAATKRPAFNFIGDYGTATSGGASALNDTTKTWQVNRYLYGYIKIVAGTGSGQTRTIQSNTATGITTTSAWTTPPDATSQYVIWPSDNGRHNYIVQHTQINVLTGGWYLNRHQTKPSEFSQDNPHAWRFNLHTKNNDDYSQSRWLEINVGGSDIDYYPFFDADRRKGSSKPWEQKGIADGVAIHNPFGYTNIRFGFQWQNIGGVGKFVCGYRDSTSEAWEEAYSVDTTQASLTDYAAADYALSSTPTQICFAVVPKSTEGEIPPGHKLTSTCTGRWKSALVLDVSSGNLGVGAWSGEAAVYDLNATIRLGGHGTAAAPNDSIVFGGEGHRVFLESGQTLEVDCDTGARGIYSGSTLIRSAPWAARVYTMPDGEDADRRSGNWLPVPPATNEASNGEFTSNVTGWAVIAGATPGFTTAIAHEAVTVYEGAGAAKFTISANPGSASATYESDTYIDTVSADEWYEAVFWVRTTNVGIYAVPVIRCYDASNVLTGTLTGAIVPGATGQWEPSYVTGQPPANTTKGKLGIKLIGATTATGTVYVDSFRSGLPLLWVSETNIGTITVTVEVTPLHAA